MGGLRLGDGDGDGDQVESLDGQVRRAGALELGPQRRRRNRPVAQPIAATAHLQLGDEAHRDNRETGRPTDGDGGRPARRVQTEGVDDGGQAAAGPRGDHRVKHRERVAGGIQIGFTAADHRPQRIGGHHLVGRKPLPGPRRLARSGRPDQDHQGGRRDGDHPPRVGRPGLASFAPLAPRGSTSTARPKSSTCVTVVPTTRS